MVILSHNPVNFTTVLAPHACLAQLVTDEQQHALTAARLVANGQSCVPPAVQAASLPRDDSFTSEVAAMSYLTVPESLSSFTIHQLIALCLPPWQLLPIPPPHALEPLQSPCGKMASKLQTQE